MEAGTVDEVGHVAKDCAYMSHHRTDIQMDGAQVRAFHTQTLTKFDGNLRSESLS